MGLSHCSSELLESFRDEEEEEDDDNNNKTNNYGDTLSRRWRRMVKIFKAGNNWTDVLKLITLSDRKQALSHKGVGQAAFLIRDAVLGIVENPAEGAYDPYVDPKQLWRNAISVICQRICSSRPVTHILQSAAWLLLILTYLEPPSWCRRGMYEYADSSKGCPALLNAMGIPATAESTNDDDDDGEVIQYYPNSHSNLITMGQSSIIETVCAGVIFCIILLRLGRDGMSLKTYLRAGPSRWNRIVQFLSLLGITVALITEYRILNPYFRLALLLTFSLGVQKEVEQLVQMLPQVFNVLAILFVFMVFYAWFGCIMFVGTEEGKQHFPNLIEALWTLWVCVTTANYPDVMMPSYNQNRWTAVYFVSFMVISFFFLMNVILASVVETHELALEKRRAEQEESATTNLKKAFSILDPNCTGRITRETVMGIFYILNEDFPEFRALSKEDTTLLFAFLDRDGTNLVSEDEFLDFGSVMLLEFIKASDYMTFIEKRLPILYASAGYQWFSRAVKSRYFEIATDMVLVLNAVVIGIQSYPELSGQEVNIDPKIFDGSIDTVWELVESIFTAIYVLECIAKVLVLGWKKYVESTKNIFDLTMTVLAVVATGIVYYPNAFSDTRLIRMIVMARVMRLLRLLMAMERFQLIGAISAEILPASRSIFMMLFLLMHLFSVIGMHLFGGLISRDPDNELSYRILGTDFSDNDYWANNFNDMMSAMNVLFNLLVINNWTECEIGFEAATQSRWVRLYFLSFHILGVILINNLVIAIIIGKFLSTLAVLTKSTDREEVEGEAVIYHREALFEGSRVTGTRTSLTGNYIARIRRVNKEGHDRERLRKLFSAVSGDGGTPTNGGDP